MTWDFDHLENNKSCSLLLLIGEENQIFYQMEQRLYKRARSIFAPNNSSSAVKRDTLNVFVGDSLDISLKVIQGWPLL